MEVKENKKLNLREIIIIFGTDCNLKCRHCYLGGCDSMAIKTEYIDALIDNVTHIDKLFLIGGEAVCYVDEIKMILDKFAKSSVTIDCIGIGTNCFVFSEELANLLNKFNQNHTINPTKAYFQYSPDKFHFEAGLTDEILNSNLEKYKSVLKDFRFVGNDLYDGISIEGSAENLSKADVECYKNISRTILDGVRKPELDNNRINTSITLCPNGYIYSHSDLANRALSANDFRYSLGNILEFSLLDMVVSYNEKHKDDGDFLKVTFDKPYDITSRGLRYLYRIAIQKGNIKKAIQLNDLEKYKKSFNKCCEYVKQLAKFKLSVLLNEVETEENEERFFTDILLGSQLEFLRLDNLAKEYFYVKKKFPYLRPVFEIPKREIEEICDKCTPYDYLPQNEIIKLGECFDRFDVKGYTEQYEHILNLLRE